MQFLAHITEINGQRIEQTVREHLINTAEYSGKALEPCGLYYCGYLSGLLHDMGKLKCEYLKYLEDSYAGIDVKKGSINHTFAGVKYILEKYHNDNNDAFDKLASEIIAFAVGSHHGEFDIIDIDGKNGFEYRINKDITEICYDEAKTNFLSLCINDDEIDKYFYLAKEEIKVLVNKRNGNRDNGRTKMTFILGMTARMVLSALIEGDRRDTAEFMSRKNFFEYQITKEFWRNHLDHFEQKLNQFKEDSPINSARRNFSDKCAKFAEHRGGIYRITIPTGAGKTLCMLRYTLEHSKIFDKKRIIFIIPLLSILDQNSKVIGEFVKDESIIQELHSNVVNSTEQTDGLDGFELLSETLSSPIVISTLVQLLNMMFSDKTSCVRRLSALCGSVIVIDEIQSLPVNMISLFNTAINFLAYYCNTTIILSSATQPCFDKVSYSIEFNDNPDMIPFDKDLFNVFKRTEVIDKTMPYGMSIDELADFSAEIMDNHSSLLVICNTKSSALRLYNSISILNSEGQYKLFHLSTAMCMQHRMDTLDKINKCLKIGQKIVCISTQLVEAGVDFSFENVIRVIAGLDNITQAAGRCNRNNDFNRICNVYIVNLKNNEENLRTLREIKTAQDCTIKLLQDYSNDSKKYNNDLLSEKSIEKYYSLFFENPEIKTKFDYPVKLDYDISDNLFGMLTLNSKFLSRAEGKDKYILNQPFKTANRLFKVFDDNTIDVIVPYNKEAEDIIADLCSQKAKFDYVYLKEKINQAKKYTIQIFEYQVRALEGMLFSDEGKHFIALNSQNYNRETGLEIEKIFF
ncbi:MAG: CRISPR-associated helicase Cas3' [Monoglobales bacterium]